MKENCPRDQGTILLICSFSNHATLSADLRNKIKRKQATLSNRQKKQGIWKIQEHHAEFWTLVGWRCCSLCQIWLADTRLLYKWMVGRGLCICGQKHVYTWSETKFISSFPLVESLEGQKQLDFPAFRPSREGHTTELCPVRHKWKFPRWIFRTPFFLLAGGRPSWLHFPLLFPLNETVIPGNSPFIIRRNHRRIP